MVKSHLVSGKTSSGIGCTLFFILYCYCIGIVLVLHLYSTVVVICLLINEITDWKDRSN